MSREKTETVPIKFPSCLNPDLPIIFSNPYEMHLRGIIQNINVLPEIDMPMCTNWLKQDGGVESYCHFESGDLTSGFQHEMVEILRGRTGVCEHWKLYGVELGGIGMELKFHNRKDPKLAAGMRMHYPSLRVLRTPIQATFREFLSGELSRHKLYFSLIPDERYGRILKVAEWREGARPVVMTYYLDVQEALLKDVMDATEDNRAVKWLQRTADRTDGD